MCVCVCACDLVCTLSFHFSAHITERFKCEICLIAKLCVRACNVQVIVEPSYALFKRFRKNSYHTTLMHELSCSIANFLYEMFCKYLSMWHDNELIQQRRDCMTTSWPIMTFCILLYFLYHLISFQALRFAFA